MAGQQVEVVANAIEKQRLGYTGLSLTEYDADNEPQIAAGSKVEIAGALFEFTADESISGWGGIGNNNDVYIKLVVSGTAITAEFTTTAPTWSTSNQGWYGTGGAALHRYVAWLRKDGSGNYTAKRLLKDRDALLRTRRWIFTSGSGAVFSAPWNGRYRVRVYGGGGGGGGAIASGTTGHGGGGGGGGYGELTFVLSAGDTITYTVGTGGSGGSSAGGNGGSGNTSSATNGAATVSAAGGAGGQGAVGGTGTGGAGGEGLTPSADLNVRGLDGGPGVGGGTSTSGYGGGSAGAPRVDGRNTNVNGAAGSAHGGGGAGARSDSAVTGYVGGAGANGAVVIDEV